MLNIRLFIIGFYNSAIVKVVFGRSTITICVEVGRVHEVPDRFDIVKDVVSVRIESELLRKRPLSVPHPVIFAELVLLKHHNDITH